MAELDTSITRIIDTYCSAVLAKNVETLMHIYEPGVRVFDAWGIWCHDGAEAWRVAVEGWLGSLGAEKVRVQFDEVHSFGTADTAVLNAIVTYAAVSATGEALRSMQNRLTWGLRTRGHVLRIAHEHTSAPIGFEDMKAILVKP